MKNQPKNHHFVPQFLMKGFSENEEHVFVYFKGKNKEFRTTTREIGAENYFHGRDDLETKIGEKFEGTAGALLKKLREENYSQPIESSFLPQLIHNHSFRTQNLRRFTKNSLEILLFEIINFYKDPENVRKTTTKLIQEDSFIYRKGIENSIKEFAFLNKKMRDQFYNKAKRDLLEQLSKPNSHIDFQEGLFIEISNLTRGVIINCLATLKNDVEESHNSNIRKMLESQNLSELNVIKYLNNFQWELIVKDENSFILGDCTCLYFFNKESIYKSFYKTLNFEIVALPISPKHLIIGKKKDFTFRVSPKEINLYSAKCSLNFFIGIQAEDGFLKLQKEIGTEEIFSKEEIQHYAREQIKRMFSKK